jgi:hypothetical protein
MARRSSRRLRRFCHQWRNWQASFPGQSGAVRAASTEFEMFESTQQVVIAVSWFASFWLALCQQFVVAQLDYRCKQCFNQTNSIEIIFQYF